MPDPWEYPWFAAWDLAFHCVTIAHLDPELAKAQLVLLLREWYLHPNGQIPAYEWNFSDVNPPVHAWAALRVFELDGARRLRFPGPGVPQAAHQLHLVDEQQGPRRQQPVPGRVHGAGQHRPDRPVDDPARPRLSRAGDSTAWMAMYALDLLDMAMRLRSSRPCLRGRRDQVLRALPTIAHAANSAGLWDDDDGFYYDVLRLADGSAIRSRCGRWSG